ncbi:MAG: hypothetical protein KatS3mg105_4219 [Gemmatales bacterium]|nr:MAG: hypothetical protein KatS3mg105_4219 [Gemmatales bacterium]
MNPAGLVDTTLRTGVPTSAEDNPFEVKWHDAIHFGRRLWLRGKLLKNGNSRNWWRLSRRSTPPSLKISARISGCRAKAEAALAVDGSFEALLEMRLPPIRRGWRLARYRVEFEEGIAESCSVVLSPPAGTERVVVVVLPIEFVSSPETGLVALRHWLREQHAAKNRTIVYLACQADDDSTRNQAELALAITASQFPAGMQIIVPRQPESLVKAIDRLCWLFADRCRLDLVNIEPRFDDVLAAFTATKRNEEVELVKVENSEWHTESSTVRQSRPTRSILVPRFPVVFCHGMLAFSMLKMYRPEDRNSFSRLRPFFRERGIHALFPQVSATSGVADRAVELRDQILAWTNEPINLIAHSMGGLDARYLITHLGFANRVKSLTTISTPHRGTYLADWFQENFRRRVPLLLALETLGINVKGFSDCRLEPCKRFNEETPDHPDVAYFSYAGDVNCQRLTPVLRRAWCLLTPVEGPNDGMVSVASSRWGEFLGTIHADHFAQTPDGVFLREGEDFDAVSFYVRIVEDLARRGF